MTRPTHQLFERVRLERDDSRVIEYVLGRLPSLAFTDVDAGGQRANLAKLLASGRERAAHIGASPGATLAVHRLDHDASADDLMPGHHHVTEAGERLISANSAIVAILRTLAERDGLGIDSAGPVITARRGSLWSRGRDALAVLGGHRVLGTWDHARSGEGTQAVTQVLAVDRAALPSAAPVGGLAFNSAYFLYEPDDVRGHHAAIYEPIGLWVDEGVIRRPPLYPRGTLYHDARNGWDIDLFDLRDVTVELPGGLTLVPGTVTSSTGGLPCTVDHEDEITLYTRAAFSAGLPVVRDRTPADPQREEFTIIDRRVVGQKRGGDLLIPQNGFVVSVHRSRGLEGALRLIAPAAGREPVTYRWRRPRHARVDRALQAGPILFRPGSPALQDRGVVQTEWFHVSMDLPGGGRRIGISPTDFAGHVDTSRRPRTAIGVDAEGGLLLVLVTGVDGSAFRPGVDSSGATLLETSDILRASGATRAVNLDGGGSTQAYLDGTPLVTPSSRRDPDHEPVERLVPSLGRAP